jgi:glutaminyl-peptide cyclotransferase
VIHFKGKFISGISLLILLLFSCNPDQKGLSSEKAIKPTKEFTLVSPALDFVCSYTDSVFFKVEMANKSLHIDSTQVYISGRLITSESISPLTFIRKNIFEKVGRQGIRLVLYFNDSLSKSLSTQINVLSDMEPVKLNYSVLRSLPHQTDAYIQGLIWYKGFLYEGTGQRSHSRLMKLDPANGKVLKERKLDNEFFGEGITRWNNTIYQLTYLQKVGFVYDLETFEKIREFDLQTMEGWGLTNDEKSLIVSDGSSMLYFYDPEYFSQVNQIDVCDDKGLVVQLNELEYVDGYIWANVYGQTYIVKIDSRTGKVIARLDLEAIIPKGIPRDIDHVLNGIAYNPESHTYYVSGKLWPLMYEIRIY